MSTTPDTLPETLTMAQIATRYGLSRRTIGRRIESEAIKPVAKLPGSTGAYLFLASDVQRAFGDTEADTACTHQAPHRAD